MGFLWVPLWGYRYIAMPYGWMLWGGVFVVLWVVLLAIFLSVLLARRPWRWCLYYEDPLEILKRRYARGEITREEYERMREDLMR
ncbi:SHOCT domain-containing protein [Candidatus Caldatribacterium sp.]|uniref:SHOCT domain-containing protein n=1 Tax=Candidatus Caldatribacterium sp. TaxID=2282143 RepID=UPI0029943AE2|nr:SHOCT domain-containing protein [Candidatus Calescibacterium sp.]